MKPPEQRRRLAVEAAASTWQRIVEATATEVLQADTPVIIREKPPAAYRLLNLRVWTIRYKVTLKWLLEFLLLVYFKNARRRNPKTLGINIAALCSTKVQKVVEDEVVKTFPQNENVLRWKQRRRNQFYPVPPLPRPGKDIVEYVAKYTDWVNNTRTRSKETAERMRRRPWRDNPWR